MRYSQKQQTTTLAWLKKKREWYPMKNFCISDQWSLEWIGEKHILFWKKKFFFEEIWPWLLCSEYKLVLTAVEVVVSFLVTEFASNSRFYSGIVVGGNLRAHNCQQFLKGSERVRISDDATVDQKIKKSPGQKNREIK